MKFLNALKSILWFVLLAGVAAAQQDGVASFGAADIFDVDTIDLMTLKPTLNVRMPSKNEMIPWGFALTQTQSCSTSGTGANSSIGCGPSAKTFNPIPNGLLGMHVQATQVTQNWCQGVNGLAWYNIYAGWQLISGDGLDVHVVPAPAIYQCGGATSFNTVVNDGSGYTVQLSLGGASMSTWTGSITSAGGNTATISGSLSQTILVETDPFGNTQKNTAGGYVDSLGATTLSSGINGNNHFWQWPDTNGVQQPITFVAGASMPVSIDLTNCTIAHVSPGSVTPISAITYPDGTAINITMEQGSAGPGTTTGRIGSFTTRQGGLVSYTYPPLCGAPGSPSFTRTTADGSSTYTQTSTSANSVYTTVLDPGKNKRVYYFTYATPTATVPLTPFLTEVQVYQNTGTVASPAYTLLSTTINCYNGNATNCPTTVVAYPITEKDVYSAPGSKTTYARTKYLYDTYGNVTSIARYDFVGIGLGTPDSTTTITYSGCGQGSTIRNLPCDVKTTAGSNTLAESKFTYNSHGFQTQAQVWTGSTWITTSASPNANGTPASTTNSLGQVTTFSYQDCSPLLASGTSTTINGVVLTTATNWDCNTGLVMSTTDANGNTISSTYDEMLRPLSQYDAGTGYTVTESYPNANQSTVGDSFATTTNTTDAYGRGIRSQKTDGSNYDTVSMAYGFNGTQFQVSSSQPCVAALNADCTLVHFGLINPLGQSISSSTTSNETVTSAHNQNDTSVTLGPAPTGEHTKTVQIEVDGLGNPKSTCAVQTSGGTSCGQVTGGYSGILTTYAHSYASGQITTTATRGVQVHTNVADAAGRLLSSTTPEAGTVSNIYDTVGTADACHSAGFNAYGTLLRTTNPDGSYACYVNDKLGRLTDVGNSNNSTTPCKRFRYDSAANGLVTAPTGYPTSNNPILGRLVEAETDNCSGTLITDEWFAYDPDGKQTDVFEKTPNSGGYYHTSLSYYTNGQPNTLSGIPGKSNYAFGLDTNGNLYSSTYGATTIGAGTIYNAAGQPTTINYGTSGQNATYTPDPNTGRITNYAFNSTLQTGALTWNPNGSLQKFVQTDQNTSLNQTCNSGYDDIERLVSFNCGSLFAQTFTYGDPYDNLKQSGSFTFNPNYNTANNQITDSGFTYDGNGNVTHDVSHYYQWDVYGKLRYAADSNVLNITRDAFGQMVEKQFNGAYSQFLYSPLGLIGTMSGQTTTLLRLPVPGGAAFENSGTNSVYFRDWLGSIRFGMNVNGAVVFDTAYAPYGQQYDIGAGGSNVANFTGDFQDTGWQFGLYNTPNREFDAGSGGRWLSPDPAHASWNAYAYPTNPNSTIDPTGAYGEEPSTCGGAEKPCNSTDNNDMLAKLASTNTCAFDSETIICGGNTSTSSKKARVDLTPPPNLSGFGEVMLAGGFMSSHGSDAAAGMMGNMFLGMLGRTSWSKWWQETGCQAGKVCYGAVQPTGGLSSEYRFNPANFYNIANTQAVFTRIPGGGPAYTEWGKTFFDYMKSGYQGSRGGVELSSEYFENAPQTIMGRNSNHWGEQGTTKWFLDDMTGARYDPASGLYLFDQPVYGVVPYNEMYPYFKLGR